MGQSTDAILFYGYCWTEETSRPWNIGKEFDDEDNEGDEWEDRYALAKGLTPPPEPFPNGVRSASTGSYVFTPAEQAVVDRYRAYWDAKEAICKPSLCTVKTHCSGDCPMPYVAIEASEVRSWRGHMNEVKSLSVDPSWDSVLLDFCNVLGIDVSNKRPTWWLVSDWS